MSLLVDRDTAFMLVSFMIIVMFTVALKVGKTDMDIVLTFFLTFTGVLGIAALAMHYL